LIFNREECGDPICQPVFWCRECSGNLSSLAPDSDGSKISSSSSVSFGSPNGQTNTDNYDSTSADASGQKKYGAPLAPQSSNSESYGFLSASSQISDVKQALGNDVSSETNKNTDKNQALESNETSISNNNFKPSNNYGASNVESMGAESLPVTPPPSVNLTIPRTKESPDSYRSLQSEVTDKSMPLHNSQLQENFGNSEASNESLKSTSTDNYDAPKQVFDATSVTILQRSHEENSESFQAFEKESSSEEINRYLTSSDSNDLQNVQYLAKVFDEPLYRDARPLKDSYSVRKSSKVDADSNGQNFENEATVANR